MVTGTEVLTGRVADANGPWLADRLLELGVELGPHHHLRRPAARTWRPSCAFLADQGVDLIVTSGGLGPTADDLTLEVVAGFAGRPLALDEALEARITAIVEPLMRRWPNVDPEAVRTATRKQALVPEGATVIEPAGTAPGIVVPGDAGSWWSCPARRASCSRCGPQAVDSDAVPGRWWRARPTTRSRCCACSASPSRRSPRRCAWPRARSTAWTGSR